MAEYKTPRLRALIKAGMVTRDGLDLTDRGEEYAERKHRGELNDDAAQDDTPHGFGVDENGN